MHALLATAQSSAAEGRRVGGLVPCRVCAARVPLLGQRAGHVAVAPRAGTVHTPTWWWGGRCRRAEWLQPASRGCRCGVCM